LFGIATPGSGQSGSAAARAFTTAEIERAGNQVWLTRVGANRDAQGRLRRNVWLSEPATHPTATQRRESLLNQRLRAAGHARSHFDLAIAPLLEDTETSITFPDRMLTNAERQRWIAEYDRLGGPNDFELEVVRLVNEIRREHGLVELAIDPILMQAARFYTIQLAQFSPNELSHNAGPYQNHQAGFSASGNVAVAFGAGGTARNGAAGSIMHSPERIVEMWMDSPGHRANILTPSHRFIGAGSHLGGRWGTFHYNMFSSQPVA